LGSQSQLLWLSTSNFAIIIQPSADRGEGEIKVAVKNASDDLE